MAQAYICPDGWMTNYTDNENGFCNYPSSYGKLTKNDAPDIFYFGPQNGGYPLNRRSLMDYYRDTYVNQINAYSEKSPTWPPVPHPALIAPPPPVAPPPPPVAPPPPPPPPPQPVPEPPPQHIDSILTPAPPIVPEVPVVPDAPITPPMTSPMAKYIPFIVGGVLLYVLFF